MEEATNDKLSLRIKIRQEPYQVVRCRFRVKYQINNLSLSVAFLNFFSLCFVSSLALAIFALSSILGLENMFSSLLENGVLQKKYRDNLR